MLAFYPAFNIYGVGTSEKDFMFIYKDSLAFTYCEYLRSIFEFTVAEDFKGRCCFAVQVSDYRIEQVHTFVGLERSFRYFMDNEL